MSGGFGKRPRPKGRLVVDPNNAYARLGVSPLSSTEEIKAFILGKRSKAMASKRSRGDDDFGAAEAEVTRLQEIEAEASGDADSQLMAAPQHRDSMRQCASFFYSPQHAALRPND